MFMAPFWGVFREVCRLRWMIPALEVSFSARFRKSFPGFRIDRNCCRWVFSMGFLVDCMVLNISHTREADIPNVFVLFPLLILLFLCFGLGLSVELFWDSLWDSLRLSETFLDTLRLSRTVLDCLKLTSLASFSCFATIWAHLKE